MKVEGGGGSRGGKLSLSGGRETTKIESGQSYNHTSPEFAQEGNVWGNSRTTPGNMAEWVYLQACMEHIVSSTKFSALYSNTDDFWTSKTVALVISLSFQLSAGFI